MKLELSNKNRFIYQEIHHHKMKHGQTKSVVRVIQPIQLSMQTVTKVSASVILDMSLLSKKIFVITAQLQKLGIILHRLVKTKIKTMIAIPSVSLAREMI